MASEIITVEDDHNEDETHVLTEQDAQAALAIYATTMGVLRPLMESARALAVLRGALAAGIVQAAREPCTPSDLAAARHLDRHRIQAVCAALEAHGIFVQEETTYRLADAWSALASPAALPWVRTGIETLPGVSRVIAAAATSDDSYWTMAAADRVDLAHWVTLDPASPLAPYLMRSIMHSVPGFSAALDAGGQYVEFGCGVGGALLSVLQAYPRATAIGVDLDGDVLAIAASRATTLGVRDRLDLRQVDAATLAEEATADVIFWAQFFFRDPGRTAALRTAYRMLKPGGVLIAALLPEAPVSADERHTSAGRDFAIDHLLIGGWGVPIRSAAEVQEEVNAVGFVPLHVGEGGFRYLAAQRPSRGE